MRSGRFGAKVASFWVVGALCVLLTASELSDRRPGHILDCSDIRARFSGPFFRQLDDQRLGLEGDAEFLPHPLLHLAGKLQKFGAGSPTAVDQHQRLAFIDSGAAAHGTAPASAA